jgi:hypothetical protein
MKNSQVCNWNMAILIVFFLSFKNEVCIKVSQICALLAVILKTLDDRNSFFFLKLLE